MPDLTTHDVVMCGSNTYWSYAVPSSKGTGSYAVSYGPTKGKYKYGFACSCPDFLWRFEPSKGEHVCKHIKAAKAFRCGWIGSVSGKYKYGKLLPDGTRVCPQCGGPLVSFMMAV